MQIQESTLLTGPYDWDERVLPKSEYDARLASVRAQMAKAGATLLLIHADPRHYAGAAWLTNFTPKNGTGMVLVPREGALRILSSGTPKMMDAAKRLTWVEEVRPLGHAPKNIGETVGKSEVVATWNFGTLPQGIHAGIAKALAPRELMAMDATLDAARVRKSALEVDLIRGAARFLTAASDTFAAKVRSGAGVRSAGLAAERAAIAAGAQDARVMASLSPGGVPLPLDEVSDERVLDPANAGIAVQNHGYWASGFITVAQKPGAAQTKAREALTAALATAKGGAKLPAGVVANAIGLSLEEGAGGTLHSGAVYAVTSSATEGVQTAYASALVVVTEGGCEVLWRQQA
jgi:hypothetical protein